MDVPTAHAGVPAPKGTLFLVATPIGNLEDISARALRVLREADLIAAEDTRVTRKLLSHFDIHTPLTAYHAHSSDARTVALLDKLRAGQNVALVSDAGTPCISDPGEEIVALAVAEGVRVEPLPGANAVLAALSASGLPTGRFVFEGFLPRNKSDLKERVFVISRETRTTILYEAPSRLVDTLLYLAKVCGETRRVCVGREITKKFEEFQRGTLAEVAAHYTETAPRGECVVVLAGASDDDEAVITANAAPNMEDLLRTALDAGVSPRDAARQIAVQTGRARNELYPIALRLRDETVLTNDA